VLETILQVVIQVVEVETNQKDKNSLQHMYIYYKFISSQEQFESSPDVRSSVVSLSLSLSYQIAVINLSFHV
jgi:hypothetical protein